MNDHYQWAHTDEPVATGYEYSDGRISIRYTHGNNTVTATRDGGFAGAQTLREVADRHGLCVHLLRSDWAGYDQTVKAHGGTGLQSVTVWTFKCYAHPRTKLPDTAPQRG